MKNFKFKKFLKYSLAVISATCAVIAGVFSISKDTVKAESLKDLYLQDAELSYNYNNGGFYQISTYVPDHALELLVKNEEIFNREIPIPENMFFEHEPNIEDVTNKKRTAYALVVRCEDNLDNYNDSAYDSYNNRVSNNHVFFHGETKTSFISGIEANLAGVYNGNFPNNWRLTVPEHTGKNNKFYWVDVVKVTYREYVVFTCEDSVYWRYNSITTRVESETLYSSENHLEFSNKSKAIERLQNVTADTDTDFVNHLLSLTGSDLTAESNVNVNLTYKKVKDFAEVETVTESFIVLGRYLYNKSYIERYMYNMVGKSNISDFNAVYTSSYIQDGNVYDTQTRVFLQAESLSYNFDTTSNVGTLNVNYAPFKYNNFVIRITNNDPTNNLTIDYFTSDIIDDGNRTVLTYTFETVERQLQNSAMWLFDINKDDFTIIDIPNITTSLSDTALTISFNNVHENNLSELSVMLVTEIIEDYELDVTYSYVKLDNTLSETTEKTSPNKMYYSSLVALGNENFKTLEATKNIYKLVIEAISPSILNGKTFYKYDGISKNYNEDKTSCNILVRYTYTTLLKIKNNIENNFTYISLNNNSLILKYDDLPFNVPSGYRIKQIGSDSDIDVSFDENNPKNLTVVINENTAQKKILTIIAELTDKWYVTVNYLERYNDTPFAVYKTVSKEVRVSDYGEIKNITPEQTATILGKNSLNVLKSAVEKLDVVYNGTSTYTITPKYSYLSLKTIDYNGMNNEIKVPLTCYEDYCKMFGYDWSILWLNSSKNTYFKYSNSVERDKLYGYFNVAVFDKQVSDLNALFEKTTGGGVMAIFKSQQVVGSNLYKFANDMKDSLLFGWAGYGLMTFCEIAEDDNKIVDTYFFYLDVEEDNHYISNGGADNRDDDDTAGENFGEDVIDKVEDSIDGVKENINSFGESIADWFENNPFAIFLKICFYLLIGAIVLFFIIWLFKKIK